MGMDLVEITMELEDEFKIQIPPETFFHELLVLGDLHKYLCLRLRERGDKIDDTQVWKRIQAIVVNVLYVSESDVTTQAHLVHDLGADT